MHISAARPWHLRRRHRLRHRRQDRWRRRRQARHVATGGRISGAAEGRLAACTFASVALPLAGVEALPLLEAPIGRVPVADSHTLLVPPEVYLKRKTNLIFAVLCYFDYMSYYLFVFLLYLYCV